MGCGGSKSDSAVSEPKAADKPADNTQSGAQEPEPAGDAPAGGEQNGGGDGGAVEE